jgi:predicted Zn-dependent protease
MFRKIFFILLLLIGITTFYFLYTEEKNTAFDSTLTPFYQILGKPILQINQILNKVIPVDTLDEKEYGEAIRLRYSYLENENDLNLIYINTLVTSLTKFKQKPFEYRVYILDSFIPNAFATPGGTLFITQGLLDILKSESELVAILSHEIGHVEKGHCFDRVRFELLTKKIGMSTLGKLADIIFSFTISTSYNKNQEDEADEYAFDLVLLTDYDPSGEGKSFKRLKETYSNRESREANIIKEYFQSHPYTEIRMEKFLEKAKLWWRLNQGKKYIGSENYLQRKDYNEMKLDSEWIYEFTEN